WEGYGGYVASGVSTWVSGDGVITIQGIPQDATVEQAFLYWMCEFYNPYINFEYDVVMGTQIGVDGTWYSFRGDVTSIVERNGDYHIINMTGFGASIVAVYSHPSSRYTAVLINDGQDTNFGDSPPQWLTETSFYGFYASIDPLANVTYILGDGQTYYEGEWRHDMYSFNGVVIATDEADGSDGNGDTHGWDTDTYNVSEYVKPGDFRAVANIYEDNDDLGWVASVFSVTMGATYVPPKADAGPDQTVNEGDLVYLVGNDSVGGAFYGITPPKNLVSWWPGEEDAEDIADSNHGTLIDGTTFDVGKVGQAFSFDGSNDRVGVADSDNLKITGSMTIDAWIFIKSFPNPSPGLGHILFRGDSRSGHDPYYLCILYNGNIRFHVENLTEWVNLEVPIPENRWVLVVATLDNATGLMRIYIDGTLAVEIVTAIRPYRDLDPLWSPGIGIGNHAPSGIYNHPFHGLIDELEIFSRALNDSEIQALFTADIAGKFRNTSSEVPIVSYEWDFESDGIFDYLETISDAPDGAFDGNTAHVYGDNGVYTVTLRVTDDSGADDTDTCVVIVNNVAPTIQPFGPFIIEEGSTLSIDGIASDPGSDDLNFIWSWGDGTPFNTSVYYNDGANPDPYPSPNGIFPFSKINSTNHTYVNCGIYKLNLTVVDDDDGITVYLTNVTVISISPPVLYINTSDDKEDVILYWEHHFPLGVDHYLIYRSTSQIAFDFNTVWVDTSCDNETGELSPIAKRTMWNDTFAALPEHDNYEEQYYYVIRMVNILGNISRTSRTVGKWTKQFPSGESTFSLPLLPMEPFYTEYYTTGMCANYIRYMDPVTHRWREHNFGAGIGNNVEMKLGEGYEVRFSSPTNYTFTGMPGAMISYLDASFGFDATPEIGDAQNLSVNVDISGNVIISWVIPEKTSLGVSYWVYRSEKRDGFWGTAGIDYEKIYRADGIGNPGETVMVCDPFVVLPGTERYYMIVPYNNLTGKKGVSTYSIGIWAEEYSCGYDSVGIPLKLKDNHTADWYCDRITDTEGINYFNSSKERWYWHSTIMPVGAFDTNLVMTEGYQISTRNVTGFAFIGV
ncbi:MAG: hypothetical protein JSW00_03725, partial [Thermoplasmata archaeon]